MLQHKIDNKVFSLINKLGITVHIAQENIKGFAAAYDSINDCIILCAPTMSVYSTSVINSIILHEIVHWTGNLNRLDRGLNNAVNTESKECTLEENIAQLGALRLAYELGLSNLSDHRYYTNYYISQVYPINKNSEIDRAKMTQLINQAVKYILELEAKSQAA